MSAYQGDPHFLSLTSAKSRAHATVPKSPLRVPTPGFVLSCPSHCHAAIHLAAAAGRLDGRRQGLDRQTDGAAA